MPSTVEYNSELGILQCTYEGQVNDVEFEEATIKAITLAKGNNTNLFLIDTLKWEGGATIVGLYKLPTLHDELSADRYGRVALISPPSDTPEEEAANFYETVCRNRGWNVKIFQNKPEAISWLKNKEL